MRKQEKPIRRVLEEAPVQAAPLRAGEPPEPRAMARPAPAIEFVQVGAFLNAEWAIRYEAEMKRKGFTTKIVVSGDMSRVMVARGSSEAGGL